jgi:queuine/archaeosine tRNA-ribosyltransferase
MKNRKSGKAMPILFKCSCGKGYTYEHYYKNHLKHCKEEK